MSRNHEESCGSFLIPPSIPGELVPGGLDDRDDGAQVEVGILVQDEEDHLIRSVQIYISNLYYSL